MDFSYQRWEVFLPRDNTRLDGPMDWKQIQSHRGNVDHISFCTGYLKKEKKAGKFSLFSICRTFIFARWWRIKAQSHFIFDKRKGGGVHPQCLMWCETTQEELIIIHMKHPKREGMTKLLLVPYPLDKRRIFLLTPSSEAANGYRRSSFCALTSLSLQTFQRILAKNSTG